MHTLLAARKWSRRAFTLVELIVVIVIIGLLAAVGAFAYNGVVSSSREHAARMMAVHFAQDAVGVAASRQVPISTMLTTDPTALANLTADTNGTGVGAASVVARPDSSLVAAGPPDSARLVAGLASLVAGRTKSTTRSASMSALVASSPQADGTTTATVAGNKITIEWGTAGPDGAVVAGATYGDYCTRVLFPGTATSHYTLGVTAEVTHCATDGGVLPAGDGSDPSDGGAGGTSGNGDPSSGGDPSGGGGPSSGGDPRGGGGPGGTGGTGGQAESGTCPYGTPTTPIYDETITLHGPNVIQDWWSDEEVAFNVPAGTSNNAGSNWDAYAIVKTAVPENWEFGGPITPTVPDGNYYYLVAMDGGEAFAGPLDSGNFYSFTSFPVSGSATPRVSNNAWPKPGAPPFPLGTVVGAGIFRDASYTGFGSIAGKLTIFTHTIQGAMTPANSGRLLDNDPGNCAFYFGPKLVDDPTSTRDEPAGPLGTTQDPSGN